MTKSLKMLTSAIVAGICIGLAGTCFLSIENRTVGALMFSLGLLTICMNRFSLFTGKVCFARKKDDFINLALIWIGNFIGCGVVGLSVHFIKPILIQRAAEMCATKLTEGFYVIPLGIFCNILIYFAVSKFNITDTMSCVLLVLCVMAFILCGFEHCIANMYYFWVCEMSSASIVYLLLNTVGNAIGGFIIGYMCEKLS